jgi:molecular chaperone GrpE
MTSGKLSKFFPQRKWRWIMGKREGKACESEAQAEYNCSQSETPEVDILTDAPESLQALLAQQTALAEEYLASLQRLQADFENFRRRTRQEREELLKYGAEGLICNLLPVLDNLERALNATGAETSLQKGVEMIFQQFKETLAGQGLEPICAIGSEFDPTKHQAVMQVPSSEHPENHVVEEFQKGYLLKDKVIRPAMVKVAVPE